MPFKPIETQEDLDALIKDRLAKQKAKFEEEKAEILKKYEGYLSPEDVEKAKTSYEDKVNALNTSISERDEKEKVLQAQLDEANAKNSQYEVSALKMRVALSNGIPYELADRLNGTTEEELIADAKQMASLFGSSQTTQTTPEYTPSNGDADGVTEAFRKLNPTLKI